MSSINVRDKNRSRSQWSWTRPSRPSTSQTSFLELRLASMLWLGFTPRLRVHSPVLQRKNSLASSPLIYTGCTKLKWTNSDYFFFVINNLITCWILDNEEEIYNQVSSLLSNFSGIFLVNFVSKAIISERLFFLHQNM